MSYIVVTIIDKWCAFFFLVEDPSEDFVRCRDYIDCKSCLKLDQFQKEKLLNGYSEDMKTAALKNYKINSVCILIIIYSFIYLFLYLFW